MKKRMLLALYLIAGSAMLKAQNAGSALIVWRVDGTKDRVELSTKPQVTFTTDSMSIVSSSVTLKSLVSDVVRITYDKPSGLKELNNDYSLRITDEKLSFHGVDSPEQVRIYAVDGKQMSVKLLQSADGWALSLSNLPAGMYLLTVNGKTYKFIKK